MNNFTASKRGAIVIFENESWVARRDTRTAPPHADWLPAILRDEIWEIPEPVPGPIGPTGPKGDPSTVPGPKGDDGKSFNPKGAWKRFQSYIELDVVELSGSSYVCRVPNKGQNPETHSREWQLLAAKGERGKRGEQGGAGQRGRAYPGWIIEQRVEALEAEIQSFGTQSTSAVFVDAASKGMPIRLDNDGAIHLAIAQRTDGGFWSCDGLALEDVEAAGTGKFVTDGIIELDDWSSITGTVHLTPARYYTLSETEPGKLVMDAPETNYFIRQVIGTALSATALEIEIQQPVSFNKQQAEFDSDAKAGMFVYIVSDDPRHVDLARADDLATAAAVGLTFGFPAAGHIGQYIIYGPIISPDKDWTNSTGSPELVPGPYWLSTTDAGMMTNIEPTTPGLYRVKLGEAIDANTFSIDPEPPILIE